ncbi:MAG: transketolase C-terminal domain-containing protein [Deltaproteobacteria bacterium]|nr:transketolase C-terminal domain-containing protein [Deltaproteobacteria bacterium]
MRNTFAETIYEAAKHDPRLCVVVADISPAGSMEKLRRDYPARFVNTGVAEQVMIGMCAGMAMRGLRPFAYSIATFSLFRPYEFIRDDLCYQELPVTVVGVGAGVAYSTLGGTHQAVEDVAVASSLPNMRVIAPCDPQETRAATQWCASQNDGPVYLRLGKAGEPVISADAQAFEFGKIRMLREGSDACVLGYGPILKLGMDAAEALDGEMSVGVASVHTLKPLDAQGIARVLARYPRVVVIEEMVPRGGLGDAVKAIAWESDATCSLRCLSLRDAFVHLHGSHADVLGAHGLSVSAVVNALRGAH